MGVFDRIRGEQIRVHVMIRGRVGQEWLAVDDHVRLPDGATLNDLIAHASKIGIPMQAALAESPHLADTLMWNGDRCPVALHGTRQLQDGDQVYLLAPLAGG